MERECGNKCELCGSENDELNFHHLIPRTLHSNKVFEKRYTKNFMRETGIMICKFMRYNTLEKLLEHPDVKKFVEWRSKRV